MTGNLKLLINFVWRFMGTVCFGNDHVAAILGYGDLQWGNILITRVYFVEGLGHNLFSVRQFCDSDILSPLEETPVSNDLVTGLPKFKYHKEHLCPSCKQGKSKRESHPPKPVLNSKQRLHLLYIDLCGLIRIASINGKRYVLVIMDDYSRYTWVHFLRSKDEALEVIKTFLNKIQVLLQAQVIIVRTDNGTEFKNQVLQEYFDSVGISYQASSVLCYPKNDREDIGKLGVKAAPRTTLAAQAPQVLQTPTTSTTIADTTPTPTNSSSQATNIPNTSQDVDELEPQQQHVQQQDNKVQLQSKIVANNVPNAMLDGNQFVNPFASPSTNAAESSSSQYVDPLNIDMFYQPYPHEYQWTKDHPLEQVIGEPPRPVLTRNQL
ncbi:retrovirus-related pol polyprotein from transposon TNT 1-94 [Tanacetum coccineum]